MFEIEKKFRFSKAWLLDTRSSPLEKLLGKAKFLSKKTFQDTYYDADNYFLTSLDIWFRQREQNYECKVPTLMMKEYETHSKTASELIRLERERLAGLKSLKKQQVVDQYKEMTAPQEIQAFLNYVMDCKLDHVSQFVEQGKLRPFSTLQTTRNSFMLDEFRIDLDQCSATYPTLIEDVCDVGEIELMVADEKDIEEASDKIVEFCKEYNLDTSAPIKSKLFSAIAITNPEHMKVLEDAGVLYKRMIVM